jgi:hypothetical protein
MRAFRLAKSACDSLADAPLAVDPAQMDSPTAATIPTVPRAPTPQPIARRTSTAIGAVVLAAARESALKGVDICAIIAQDDAAVEWQRKGRGICVVRGSPIPHTRWDALQSRKRNYLRTGNHELGIIADSTHIMNSFGDGVLATCPIRASNHASFARPMDPISMADEPVISFQIGTDQRLRARSGDPRLGRSPAWTAIHIHLPNVRVYVAEAPILTWALAPSGGGWATGPNKHPIGSHETKNTRLQLT